MSFLVFESAARRIQAQADGGNARVLAVSTLEDGGNGRLRMRDCTRHGIHQAAEDPPWVQENICVYVKGGMLKFEVDEYSASGDAEADALNPAGYAWDEDEWNKRLIEFSIEPLGREAWTVGYRFARMLLSGHSVAFPSGKVLLGVGIRQWRRK